VVIGSDLRRTGWFTTPDRLLNRLHDNVVWSMRGNFLDVPVDCPQRDERLSGPGTYRARPVYASGAGKVSLRLALSVADG
jgi:alpha-L-rhamnosidase